MKERRGPIGRAVEGVAGGIAGTLRRRQREREPRAVVYDLAGHGRVVAPGSAAHERLVTVAERMVELAFGGRSPAPEAGDGAGGHGDADGSAA